MCKPVTVFNGECKHDYVDFSTDEDGITNARCTKCPMGIFYRKKPI